MLDGGAFNLLNDRFDTANGDDIPELTLSGELFDIFRRKGEFNWESSFAYTSGTVFMPKYEWQIWPQRLYMTIPLAHRFFQTGERKYADARLTIVKEWDNAVSEKNLQWYSRMFFKKNDVYFAPDKHTMQLLTDDSMMTLRSDAAIQKELVPVMNEHNKLDYAVLCRVTIAEQALKTK